MILFWVVERRRCCIRLIFIFQQNDQQSMVINVFLRQKHLLTQEGE